MAIIEQGNLSVSNALFGDKTFKARKVKVADFNIESVTDEWTENKEYEIKPGAGYDLIDKANITVNVDTMPKKGDVINIDMNGDGTAESYLVLKGSGTTFELLARTTPTGGTSIAFDSGGTNVYAEKTLDTYLNETYYATLSAAAKTAIVDKTFTQDMWSQNSSGSLTYHATRSSEKTPYTISLSNASYGNEITRHIYALSVQDIIDYLEVTTDMTSENTTLNMENILNMFNISSSSDFAWLSSATASSGQLPQSERVYFPIGSIGDTTSSTTGHVRPTFQIDLSKITWTPEV